MNRTGTAYHGNITCKLSNTLQPIAFKVDSISHIQNLFLRRKSRLKIKSENENVKFFLEKNNAFNKLINIAKKENFSPIIICELSDSAIIQTKYHLEFDDWTQVIEPIIELYKNLIDEFEKRVANISVKAYRDMD